MNELELLNDRLSFCYILHSPFPSSIRVFLVKFFFPLRIRLPYPFSSCKIRCGSIIGSELSFSWNGEFIFVIIFRGSAFTSLTVSVVVYAIKGNINRLQFKWKGSNRTEEKNQGWGKMYEKQEIYAFSSTDRTKRIILTSKYIYLATIKRQECSE